MSDGVDEPPTRAVVDRVDEPPTRAVVQKHLGAVQALLGDYVFSLYLDALKQYQERTISIDSLIERVEDLFAGHTDLLLGFRSFLPAARRCPSAGSSRADSPAATEATRSISMPDLLHTAAAALAPDSDEALTVAPSSGSAPSMAASPTAASSSDEPQSSSAASAPSPAVALPPAAAASPAEPQPVQLAATGDTILTVEVQGEDLVIVECLTPNPFGVPSSSLLGTSFLRIVHPREQWVLMSTAGALLAISPSAVPASPTVRLLLRVLLAPPGPAGLQPAVGTSVVVDLNLSVLEGRPSQLLVSSRYAIPLDAASPVLGLITPNRWIITHGD